MTTSIAAAVIDQTGKLTVSLSSDSYTIGPLVLDNVKQPGRFVGTVFGFLYQAPDGSWGVPNVSWGVHDIDIAYTELVPAHTETSGLVNLTAAPHPNASLIGPQLTVAQAIDAAYKGGFHTSDGLTAVVSLMIQESGLFSKARNWHPELGFRPITDVLGVTTPVASSITFNSDGQQAHSDRGILQWFSEAHPDITDAQADDPVQASALAFADSANGTDFSLWAAWAASKAHYDAPAQGWPAIRPLVQAYLATKP